MAISPNQTGALSIQVLRASLAKFPGWQNGSFENLIRDTSEDTAVKVFLSFVNFLRATMERAEEMGKGDDKSSLGAAAHRLKPTSQTMGFMHFRELCEALDNHYKGQRLLENEENVVREWIAAGRAILACVP